MRIAPVTSPTGSIRSATAAIANSAPSQFSACTTEREKTTSRRYPVAASPSDQAPLISIAPRRASRSMDSPISSMSLEAAISPMMADW